MKRFLFILAFISSFLFAQDSTKNFALGALYQGISATDTSLTLIAGHGSRFPLSGDFNAVIWDYSSYGWNITGAYLNSKAEIVRVTANSANVLTITRAQEGTTARAFNVSGHTYFIQMNVTGASAKWYQDVADSLALHRDSIDAHTTAIDGLLDSIAAIRADSVDVIYFFAQTGNFGAQTTTYFPWGETSNATSSSAGADLLFTITGFGGKIQAIYAVASANTLTDTTAIFNLWKNFATTNDSIIFTSAATSASDTDCHTTVTATDKMQFRYVNNTGSGTLTRVSFAVVFRKPYKL